jgi:hypothetical protein
MVVSPQYPAAIAADMRRGQQPEGMIDGRLERVKDQPLMHPRGRVHSSLNERVALLPIPRRPVCCDPAIQSAETPEGQNLLLGSLFFIRRAFGDASAEKGLLTRTALPEMAVADLDLHRHR